MTDGFRNFCCWRSPVVQKTIFGDIGVLGTEADAVFLAAHARVPITRDKGIPAEGQGEAEILNALRGEFGLAERNTLISITGSVGTGKSHAVRWIRAHLPDEPSRYRMIYVPRDVSTLRDLLGEILDGMPGEKAKAAARQLDEAVGLKPDDQLKTALIDNLREVLAHELPDKGPGDPEVRRFLLGERADHNAIRRNGLSDVLHNLAIIEHLSREDGTVTAVIRSLKARRTGRDEDYPQFSPADLPTRMPGVKGKLDPGPLAVWNSIIADPEPAVRILDEALKRAAPMTMGFGSGVTLDGIFREAREILRKESAELILLFEDLALFGLIDDALYDQFVIPPGDTYCPLRIVFAITTSKYRDIRDTVLDRVTHHYIVQNFDSDAAQDASEMTTFVARYLNVARVGRDELIDARDAADGTAREAGTWIPNACDTREQGSPCRFRDECFSAFGSASIGAAGSVGLYPYNKSALRRAFVRLRDREVLSPRSLVNDVVYNFLTTVEPEISQGDFPTEEISNWFDMETDRPQEVIAADDGKLSHQEVLRLRRTRIVWADCEVENYGIHQAFGLPGDPESRGAAGPQTISQPPAPELPQPEPLPIPGLERTPRPDPAKSLYAWERGEPMPVAEMTAFRRQLYNWVAERADFARHLVHVHNGVGKMVLDRHFSETTFDIKGAPGAHPGPGRLHFEIPRSPQGLRLLLGTRWFADHGHWEPDHRYRKWDFPLGLKPLDLQVPLENWLCARARDVEEYVLRALSAAGTPPAVAVATLRAAALRVIGRLEPGTGPADAVDAIGRPRSRPTGSWSPAWQSLATQAAAVIDELQADLIAAFASARQGESREPIVIDAAALEPAVLAATRDPVTAVTQLGTFPVELSEIERSRVNLSVNWSATIAAERGDLLACLRTIRDSFNGCGARLIERAEDLGTRAHHESLFRPVGSFRQFTEAIDAMKSVPPDAVDAWLAAENTLSQQTDAAAIFDAQSWAEQARAYARQLNLMLTCLRVTAQETDQRNEMRPGENLDVLATRVAARLDETATLIERLYQGGPA
jgi:hypothetical protein